MAVGDMTCMRKPVPCLARGGVWENLGEEETEKEYTFLFSSVRRAAFKAPVCLACLLPNGRGVASLGGLPSGANYHPISESPVGQFQQ